MACRIGLLTAVLACVAGLLAAGCQKPDDSARINAPPYDEGETQPEWARCFVYHNDQGMMADMSIADIHFVPHSPEMSGTGAARLERYAELLATHGGSIRYQPTIRDVDLVQTRLETAKAFLAQAMPGGSKIDIVTGLARGRGMTAAEAEGGTKVAHTPEPRENAYYLNVEASGD